MVYCCSSKVLPSSPHAHSTGSTHMSFRQKGLSSSFTRWSQPRFNWTSVWVRHCRTFAATHVHNSNHSNYATPTNSDSVSLSSVQSLGIQIQASSSTAQQHISKMGSELYNDSAFSSAYRNRTEKSLEEAKISQNSTCSRGKAIRMDY